MRKSEVRRRARQRPRRNKKRSGILDVIDEVKTMAQTKVGGAVIDAYGKEIVENIFNFWYFSFYVT